MSTAAATIKRWGLGALLGLTILVMAVAVGGLVPQYSRVGLGLALSVLVLGISAVSPTAIALVVVPLLLVVYRVGAGGIDLSVSDAALFLATVSALVFAPRPFSPTLRNLLWIDALYQVGTLFTVIANPYVENTVEWFHAWMLVSGALIVGWSLGRAGKAKAALALFLGTAFSLASVTIVQALGKYAIGDFGPVYVTWPFPMHKNFVGGVMALAATVAYARPPWLGLPRHVTRTLFWVFATALLVTQSRQAIVGLVAAILLLVLRRSEHYRRSRWIVTLILPAVAIVGLFVQEQLELADPHGSVMSRLTSYQDSIALWRESPWVGQGLRFWYTAKGAGFIQPPNAEFEVMASAGVIGLAAFLTLMIGALVLLWRVDPRYGTLAAAAVLCRFTQGQLDLFWSAIGASMPFVIAGICLGAASHAESPDAARTGEPQDADASPPLAEGARP